MPDIGLLQGAPPRRRASTPILPSPTASAREVPPIEPAAELAAKYEAPVASAIMVQATPVQVVSAAQASASPPAGDAPAEDVIVKFKKDTIIRCAAIYALEKSMLSNRVMQLSIATMKDVDERLKHVLDLN